jgi:hypothetical protein
LAVDVPVDKLREWYRPSDLLGLPGELVIDGSLGQADTLRTILEHLGPIELPSSVDRGPARFL